MVRVNNAHLALFAHGDAHQFQVERRDALPSLTADVEGIIVQLVAHVGGKHRANLGDGILGSERESIIRLPADPLRSRHERLNLFFCEGQRRQ